MQRLRRYVGSLETETKDLKNKLEEITDKQVHCVGVQTQQEELKKETENALDKIKGAYLVESVD